MQSRNITSYIESLALSRQKMVFLSGPRQTGKTTLAKSLLYSKDCYFDWDHVPFRKRWLTQVDGLAESLLALDKPRIVLDEFHKNKKWRNQLKGFYDQYGDEIQIILTGSAKLNAFRKGTDSLLGRFVHFHLLPFTLGELISPKPMSFVEFVQYLHQPLALKNIQNAGSVQQQLFKYGGFPEPFKSQSDEFHRVWHRNRLELLIRQDLKDLSNIVDVGHVEILASFLPEKVGSPLSVQSLREDLDIAHTTASRWLMALSQVYYQFDVRPHSKSIARSLKKEPKIYLYDWSEIEDLGPRFENMVAAHLLKMVHFYNDTGQADLRLHYLRDKDGHEVDFIVLNRNRPLFSLECKLTDRSLDRTFYRFHKKLSIPHFQVIRDNFFRKFDAHVFIVGFENFFSRLP